MSQPPGRYLMLSVAVVGVVLLVLWLRPGANQTPSPSSPPVQTQAALPSPQPSASASQEADALPSTPPHVLASRLTPLVDPASLKSSPRMLASQQAPLPTDITKGRLVEKRESAPSAQGYVRRVSVYETGFKYPYLRVEEQYMRNGQGAEVVIARSVMVADHFLIRLQKGWNEQQLVTHLGDLGLTIRRQLPKSAFYIAALPGAGIAAYDKALEALSTGKGPAAYAEPDFIAKHSATPVYPNDASFAQLWGMDNTGQTGGVADADIDAPEAWEVTTGSAAVTVAVIDSGVDYTHPDLAANMWTNPGEIADNDTDDDNNGYVDDVHGYDFFNVDADPQDDNGHGSHVAGTLGAVGGNGTGVAGVCHTVRIMALKFLSSEGEGALSDAVEAINYATNAQVLLTSNSWGGGGYTQALKDVIDDAGAAGIGCVVAAGNSTNNNDLIPEYPSSYDSDNIIAVAATNASDLLASFSSYGATSVDLAAPGEAIYSTTSNGGYATYNGTSMAAPHVSGACALLKAANPDLTFTAIKEALMSQADPVAALANRCLTGARLNVAKAMVPATGAFLRIAQVTVLDDQVNGANGNGDGVISPGESFTLALSVKNSGATLSPGVQGVLTFRTPNPNMALGQDEATYGDLGPGVTVGHGATPFLIHIDPATTTPSEIPLRLTLTDAAAQTWTEDLTLHVYTVATVSGRVTKVTGGGPVENASVKIIGTMNQNVTTDATGHYSATVVNGEYTVQAMASGFIPSATREATVPPSAVDIDFALGFSNLQVTPTALSETLFEDEVKTQTLVLQNNGDQSLTYRLDEVQDLNTLGGGSAPRKPGDPGKPLLKPRRSQEGFFQQPAPLSMRASGGPKISSVGMPFSDGFESGNYSRWFDSWGNGTREVVTDTAARGTHSFHFHHDGPPDHLTGIHQEFDYGTQPGHVSFNVRPGADDVATCYFVLGDVYFIWLADFIWFFANDNGRFYINDDVGGNQAVTYQPNQWYHVEFRDIDWSAKTFDYYVDGTLVQADIPFRNPDVATQCLYAFAYNYSENTDAWWDEVFISTDALYWFDLSQKTGTIPPGGSETITVTFNATGLLPTTYSGKVVVTSNDPATPEITVPVTMQVNAIPNDPPVAYDQTVSFDEDTLQIITLTGEDPDGNPLTCRITQLPERGQLYQCEGASTGLPITAVGTEVTNANRRVIFIPNANDHGSPYADFEFVLRDKKLDSLPATVSLEINPQPDAPLLMNDQVSVLPGEAFPDIAVLLNDTAIDGGALSVVSFTQPARGTVVDAGGGLLTYIPGADFAFGTDTFAYTATDGASQASAVVTVTRGYLRGGDWATYGHNSSRTGHYPGKTGGKLFSPKWTRGFTKMPLQPVIAGGTVYVSFNASSASTEVAAFNVGNGQSNWLTSYPVGPEITSPTFANGKLFLQRPSQGSSLLSCLNAVDGGTHWNTLYTGSANASYKSPLVTSSAIVIPGLAPQGFGVFNMDGGKMISQPFAEGNGWTPTLGGGRTWSATGGVIRSHDVSSGALRDDVTPPASAGASTVVYDGGRAFVNLAGQIRALNPDGTSLLWSSLKFSYAGTPAVSRGVVYAIFGVQPYAVHALDSETGVLLRTFALPSAGVEQPVVCEDALIVGGSSQTFVFGLADGAHIQTIPYGGVVAVADSTLLITHAASRMLRAYTAPASLGLSPHGGSFAQPVDVTFSTSLSSSRVHFTTDGTVPTADSPSVQTGGVLKLESSSLLKAVTRIGDSVSDVTTVNFTITDSDGDGLPDWWEGQQASSLNNTSAMPLADDDHDGMTTMEEFVAGTNPDSFDRFDAAVQASGNGPVISWMGLTGRVYTVEASDNMVDWEPVTPPQPGTASLMVYEESAPSPPKPRFFRVNVRLP